jgi:hypothetical protein
MTAATIPGMLRNLQNLLERLVQRPTRVFSSLVVPVITLWPLENCVEKCDLSKTLHGTAGTVDSVHHSSEPDATTRTKIRKTVKVMLFSGIFFIFHSQSTYIMDGINCFSTAISKPSSIMSSLEIKHYRLQRCAIAKFCNRAKMNILRRISQLIDELLSQFVFRISSTLGTVSWTVCGLSTRARRPISHHDTARSCFTHPNGSTRSTRAPCRIRHRYQQCRCRDRSLQ